MTAEAFATFSVCLQYKPAGNSPAWDDGCARYYFAMLEDVPDEAVPSLMKAVGRAFKFRPEPCEIIEAWDKINSADVGPKAEEVAGKMLRLRRQNGLYQRRVPDDPYCRWEQCEPPWTDPVCAQTSHVMGGWAEFCADASPSGVLRSQLTKAAAAVLSGQADTAIDRLRAEYQEHRRLTAPAPALGVPGADEPARFPMAEDERNMDEPSAWAAVGRVAKAIRLDRADQFALACAEKGGE